MDIIQLQYITTIKDYLKFEFNGVLYQYTCLPNGLASAPRIFTKLLKPVYCTLRSMGHLNSAYIDDSYLQGDSVEECNDNITATATLMTIRLASCYIWTSLF